MHRDDRIDQSLRRSRKSTIKIGKAVGPSLAFALHFVIPYQAVKPCTRIAVVARANEPRNRCAGEPHLEWHLLQDRSLDPAGPHALRGVAGAVGQFVRPRAGKSRFPSPCVGALHRANPFYAGLLLALVSVATGLAILSFISTQALRTEATISEQFSICSKTRLASAR